MHVEKKLSHPFLKKLYDRGMRCYRNLFFSTHFSGLDVVFAAFLFVLTMLLSTIITHDAQVRRGEPFFLHNAVATSAITLYQTGNLSHYDPGKNAENTAKIEDFLYRQKQELDNQDLKDLSGHKYVSLFGCLYSINAIVSFWWHFIGFPSKIHFSLCLGVIFGFASVITYFILRLCGGALCSLFLTLLIQCSVSQLAMLYLFRDWSRVIPILPLLFLIVWIVRNGLSWKRAVWGGILAGSAIGFGRGFRTDFYFFLPFLACAVCCFPRLKSNWWRKIAFLLITALSATIIIGYYRCKLPERIGDEPGLSIVYMALASELLDPIVTSPRQYTWSPMNVDEIFEIVPAAIAGFRYGETNVYKNGEVYNRTVFNELMRVGCLFPYDFSIIACSSAINILQHSVVAAKENAKRDNILKHTTRAYSTARIFSEDILKHISGPVCVFIVFAALLVTALFSFRKFIFYTLMGLLVLGMCAAQWQSRHYFYAFIYVLMAANTLFYLLLRLFTIFVRFRSRALKKIFASRRKYQRAGMRYLGILLFLGVVLLFLLGARYFQYCILRNTAKEVALAEKQPVTTSLIAEEEAVKEDGPARVIKTGHLFAPQWTHYDIPELNRQKFFADPKAFRLSHCEFLTLKFHFPDQIPEQRLSIILRYQSDLPNGKWRPGHQQKYLGDKKRKIWIYPFSFFSQWVEGPIVRPGELYFITPVYYYKKDQNGFRGFSIPAEFVPYLQEVAILKDRKLAPCNWQFFLSPDNFDQYQYHQYLTWDNLVNKNKY